MQPLENPTSALEPQGEPFLQISEYTDSADTLMPLRFSQAGDQIVEVNGIDFSNLDHKEVRLEILTYWLLHLCPPCLTPPPATVSETCAL